MLESLTPAQKLVIILTAVALALGLWLGTGVGRNEDAAAEGNRVTYMLSDAGSVPITVHVVGAVQRSGMYQLPAGSRVSHAVQAAGGFTERADRESVNLAAFVDDGEQVKVDVLPQPERASMPPSRAPQPARTTSHSQPRSQPTRPIAPSASAPEQRRVATPQASPGSDLPSWAQRPSGQRVRLNHAGLDELQSIDGIGPELAKNIIYYRSMHGPFSSFDELDDVPDIGPATIEKIRVSATLN
ncbi:MAG: hypothetical protein GF393_02875 [Armatimonadia bacterium]|nr:hypothetical protein [Armatimonadia bacterium]